MARPRACSDAALRCAVAAAFLVVPGRAHADEPEPLAPWPDPPAPVTPDPKPENETSEAAVDASPDAGEPEASLALPPRETPLSGPDPWRFIIAGHGRLDLGTLPALAFGLGGGVGVRVSRLRVDLDAAFWFPQRRVIDGTVAGGDFRLFTGGLTGCAVILREPIELAPCVGAELGNMSVESFGVQRPGQTDFLWSAFLGKLQAAWVFAQPFALRAEVGAAVPFRRPRWTLVPEGGLDRPGLVSARAQFGIELHL